MLVAIQGEIAQVRVPAVEFTNGTFKVEPLAIHSYDDELVVAHARDTMIKDEQSMSLDALAILRIVDGRIA